MKKILFLLIIAISFVSCVNYYTETNEGFFFRKIAISNNKQFMYPQFNNDKKFTVFKVKFNQNNNYTLIKRYDYEYYTNSEGNTVIKNFAKDGSNVIIKDERDFSCSMIQSSLITKELAIPLKGLTFTVKDNIYVKKN